MRYGIVGFGTAGYHALKTIRHYDRNGWIDVYCATGAAPYNPMLTTYYASGRLDYEGMFPFGGLDQIQKQINFHYIKERVIKINANKLSVETEHESRIYDRILVSTGARAFKPPVKGAVDKDIFLMRTIEDADRLKQRLDMGNTGHAVVVGASMVGIKVAELLNKRGIRTCLADLADFIFPLAAYRDVAEAIGRRVEKKGICLHFNGTIDHLEQSPNGQTAVMTDGVQIPADIVVLCIGTRADTDVVRGQVEINRGILVNKYMETSMPGIFAAGDCCEGNNIQYNESQVIGLWANANDQGTVAGANMAGHRIQFPGNFLHNITHFMDMDFIGFGDTRIQGDRLEQGNLDQGLFLRLVCKDGKIAGANILDHYRISGIIKNYMMRLFEEENRELPEFQRAMLIQAGLAEEFIDEIERRING